MARAQKRASDDLASAIREVTNNGWELLQFALMVLRGAHPEASMSDRRWAAEFLAERGFGRAPIEVEITHAKSIDLDLDALSDEQLLALRDAMKRALESGSTPAERPPLPAFAPVAVVESLDDDAEMVDEGDDEPDGDAGAGDA